MSRFWVLADQDADSVHHPSVEAIERRGTLATDDLAACRVASEQDVATIGSIGILVRGITRDILAPEAANNQLATWRDERGYYSPVDRIEDAIE